MTKYLALLLAACASAEPIAPYETHRLGIDPSAWSPPERAALDRACAAWAAWSEGGLRCEVVAEGPVEARFVAAPCAPYLGRLRRRERELAIDLAAIRGAAGEGAPDLVRLLAETLLGQAAGMARHAGAGVLSSEALTEEFTIADRAACMRAGFCRGSEQWR